MQGTGLNAQHFAQNLHRAKSAQAAQAPEHGGAYDQPVPSPESTHDSMLEWLAEAAATLRLAAEPKRKQVHIAAGADVDQSTINRFEKAEAWPKNPDTIVRAYADDLDVDPIQIWEHALRLWAQNRAANPGHVAETVERETRKHPGQRRRSGATSRRPSNSRAT
jgi:hypothetical protein